MFWDDKWIPSSKDFKIHSARPLDCQLEMVSDLIDQHAHSWKEREVRNLVLEEEANVILCLPIAQSGRFLVWHYEAKGSYSVKSGHRLALEAAAKPTTPKPSSSYHPPEYLWKSIWSLHAPPKLKHFWWKSM